MTGRDGEAGRPAGAPGGSGPEGRRFGPAQRQCVERLLAVLEREVQGQEPRVDDASASVRLAASGTVIVLEPAVRGAPCFFAEGGVAVHYQGRDMTPDLRRGLAIAHRLLKTLPPEASWGPVQGKAPPPPGEGRSPDPDPPPSDPQDGPARRACPPLSLMAVNGSLAVEPHDPAVRRVAELLWKPCPTLKLGHACNVFCAYCCAGDDGPRMEPEAELRGQVDALRRLGFRGVGYMGGEPTIHPGLTGLVRHARQAGFQSQVLVTNGVRLADAAFTATLVDAGIDVVIQSLDTFDGDVQERLLGGPAVFPRILAGLDNLLATPGVEVTLAAVVTALNADLLPAYVDEVARRQQRSGKAIGVLLHALQQPAKDGPEQRALHLPLQEAAAKVCRALDRAREAGVAVLCFSLPPCLMPGHEDAVIERYTSEWDVDLETGAMVRSRRRGVATWWAGCMACPHVGRCPGVLNQYADDALRARVQAYSGPPNLALDFRKPAG